MDLDDYATIKARHLRGDLDYAAVSAILVYVDDLIAENHTLKAFSSPTWGTETTRKAAEKAHNGK